MRHLLPALLLFPLACCAATSQAIDSYNKSLEAVKASVAELQAAQANPASTQEQLDALSDAVAAAVKESIESAKAVPGSVGGDLEGLKDLFPGGTDSVWMVGLTGLAWWLRDRRKKMGKDPVQIQIKAEKS